MAYNNIYRSIRGKILRITDKAVQFQVRDSEALTVEDEIKTEWLPKSHLKFENTKADDFGEVTVMASEWILNQKGWKHLSVAASNQRVNTPAPTAPPLPSRPPAKSFVDMDDDIPF